MQSPMNNYGDKISTKLPDEPLTEREPYLSDSSNTPSMHMRYTTNNNIKQDTQELYGKLCNTQYIGDSLQTSPFLSAHLYDMIEQCVAGLYVYEEIGAPYSFSRIETLVSFISITEYMYNGNKVSLKDITHISEYEFFVEYITNFLYDNMNE